MEFHLCSFSMLNGTYKTQFGVIEIMLLYFYKIHLILMHLLRAINLKTNDLLGFKIISLSRHFFLPSVTRKYMLDFHECQWCQCKFKLIFLVRLIISNTSKYLNTPISSTKYKLIKKIIKLNLNIHKNIEKYNANLWIPFQNQNLPSQYLPNTHSDRDSASGAARVPSANQTHRYSRFRVPSARRDAFPCRRSNSSVRSWFRPPRSLSLRSTTCISTDCQTVRLHDNGRTASG